MATVNVANPMVANTVVTKVVSAKAYQVTTGGGGGSTRPTSGQQWPRPK
jgi:hypothetical protein